MCKLYNAITTAQRMGVQHIVAINITPHDTKALVSHYNDIATVPCTKSADIAKAMGVTIHKVTCDTTETDIRDEVGEYLIEHNITGQWFVLCSDYPSLDTGLINPKVAAHITQ